MRLTLDIDDRLIRQALDAGPFKTTKAAVEAGLKLLAKQGRYKDILKWAGKLPWQGDVAVDWSTDKTEAEPAVGVDLELAVQPDCRRGGPA